jgi:hypothetical protein
LGWDLQTSQGVTIGAYLDTDILAHQEAKEAAAELKKSEVQKNATEKSANERKRPQRKQRK